MTQQLPLKVINLFAGPGAGKSTLAAGLFNLMKNLGYRVELVTEFAKDATYEQATILSNQLVVLAEQDRRLRRLVGQVDWVITDSPLPLGAAYMTPEYEEWLVPAIWGAFDRYQNYSVLLKRGPAHPYQQYGRSQTEAEAMALDNVIGHLFDRARDGEEDFSMEVESNAEAPYRVFEELVDGE